MPVATHRAGYSERTAKQQGPRLLTNGDVQAAIAEAGEARAKRTGASPRRMPLIVAAADELEIPPSPPMS